MSELATRKDVRSLIQSDSVKQQMAMVLPKHLTADRMARVACTAILKTPKLATCKPESLLQALMLCSQAGLEPDGRNAHLIPYGDQVQVIFDWKGLVALARRNGVTNIASDVVCENDQFEWFRDADGLHFKHLVDWRKERGPVFATYCIWKDGEQFDGEVMARKDVEAIRNRSRASNSGPWVTDWNEMAKKTVVRRASKKWPLDAELAAAINDDDDTPPQVTVAPVHFAAAAVPALPEPTAETQVTQPEAQPEPKAPEPTPTPTAQPQPAQATQTRADMLDEYFKEQCNATYSVVQKTLIRLNTPKNADSFESFAAMSDGDLTKVWQARRGIAAEVKRDAAAASMPAASTEAQA